MFNAILNQMIVLFGFMAIGYLLGITKLVPENSASVLSKLENYLFVPCFVFSAMARDFTIENFSEYWIYAVYSLLALALTLALALAFAKSVYKDELNWEPTYNCEQALYLTADWYKNYYLQNTDMYEYTLKQINDYEAQIKWKQN